MIAAGFGCRKGCESEDLAGALAAALARAGRELAEVRALYAPDWKAEEAALSRVAHRLGKPLVWLAPAALCAQANFTITHSERALSRAGVPSVAETAALAGAAEFGASPALLGPRETFGGATCALAIGRSRT